MTAKAVIVDSLQGKHPSRVPVALLSAGAWTFNQHDLSLEDVLGQPEHGAEIIIDTSDYVRSDIVWPGSGYHNLVARALGGSIKFRRKGAIEVLAPVVQEAQASETFDLSRLAEDTGIAGLWKMAGLVEHAIGDRYLVGSSQWGPFTLAGQLYGVERLMRSIYRDPAAVHAVVDFAAKVCYQYLLGYVQAGVEIISLAEPTASGDMISREQFAIFVQPALRSLVNRFHEAGVFVVVHSCGNITNRLDLIIQAGADLVSVDYKVDLRDAKIAADAGHACFSGNMNPVAIMEQGTPNIVADAVRARIATVGGDGNYVVMPGCDIPPSVPLENIRAMVDVALNTPLASVTRV
ncbi:MAG TPA: uroporphyrinogen decarboxylase family protein [Armatimonadota bacterium]|nr:uroporphyrinogen decarboxylase family protein [Armatimonadota bacterium]